MPTEGNEKLGERVRRFLVFHDSLRRGIVLRHNAGWAATVATWAVAHGERRDTLIQLASALAEQGEIEASAVARRTAKWWTAGR